MRTVRSVARARNHRGEVISYGREATPRRRMALWIVLAVLFVLSLLATHASAAPCEDDDDCFESRDACPGGDCDVVHEPRPIRVAADDATNTVTPSDCPMRLPVAGVAAAAVRAAGLDHDPVPSWSKRARLAGLVPTISARVGRNLSWKAVDDPTLGYTNMFDIRASWSLERLMFDPNEIRIAAMDVSRRRERRRVEMLAIHTYGQWLAASHGSARAVEITAELDAMTDGWFSEALKAK